MKIYIYDIGDNKEPDRYTLVVDRGVGVYNGKTGLIESGACEVYGMSVNALDVQGFNYFSHEVPSPYIPDKEAKQVELKELPHDVLVAIIERMQTV